METKPILSHPLGITHFNHKSEGEQAPLLPSPFIGKSRAHRARNQSIATVIVDRSALFRAGLVHTLAETHFRVAAQCARLDELDRSTFGAGRCCVFVIGLDNPVQEIEVYLSDIRNQFEKSHIIFLGSQVDDSEFNSVIKLGGACYMLKHEVTADTLLRSMELVISGEEVFSHEFMKKLRSEWVHRSRAEVERNPGPGPAQEPSSALPVSEPILSEGRLSNRENAILMGLMQGASNKHIARELKIAEATVKVHVKSVLRKIRVKNRTQAAMWAWSHGAQGNKQATLSVL